MSELFSYSYSIPYLIYFVLTICFVFFEFKHLNKGEKYYYLIVLYGLIFLLFFGARGYVYTDWYSYYALFKNTNSLITLNSGISVPQYVISDNVEIGFLFFVRIFKIFSNSYDLFVFTNSLIDLVLLLFIFRKHSNYIMFSFLLFLSFGGLNMEINLLRNIKSILLFFISIEYLYEGKFYKYSLINIIGSLFHVTSIIYIPLYFIFRKSISKRMLVIVFLLGNAIYLLKVAYIESIMMFLGDVLGGKFQFLINFYFNNDLYAKSYPIGLGYFERILTFLLVVKFYDNIVDKYKYGRIYINIYFVYFIVCFFLSELFIAVDRLSLLFVLSYWVLYPIIINSIESSRRKKLIFYPLVLFCFFKILAGNNTIFAYYDNSLFGKMSYEQRKLIFDTCFYKII